MAAVIALIGAFTVGCVRNTGVTPMPAPTSAPSGRQDCATRIAKGRCGPYDDYERIVGTTSSTYIGNNVWNPISGWRQTLSANSPGDWQVVANMPRGNRAVVSYPSVGANYGQITNAPAPLSSFSAIRSSFSETMSPSPETSAWAAYDIWLGRTGCSSCAGNEVMIQHDFANNGACEVTDRAEFGGDHGVAGQDWHLCRYGSELIWKLGPDEKTKVSEQAGSVDILAMLTWLVQHRYLPADAGLWLIGYGWEICSTGGQDETFQVSNFSIAAAR